MEDAVVLGAVSSDRLALAQAHDSRFRELERIKTEVWSEQAELAITIQDNTEYLELGFQSFGRWLASAAPKSRSAMYAYMALVRELEEVPTKDLRQMDVGSAKVVAKVPKRLRSPEIIEAAKLEPRETVKFVQERHPDLHIETQVPRQYAFTRTQATAIDGAIELCRVIKGVDTEPEALEAICADYLISHQDVWKKIQAGEIVV